MADRQSQALGLEVSLSTLAREFGMARETISKRLLAAGIQPSGRNRGNDVYRVGAAARAIVAADYGGATGPVIDPDTLGPKDQADYWKGKNEKLKFERDSGLAIEKPEHDAVVFELGGVLVSAMESIPDLLERRCHLEPEQLDSIEEAINQARERIAEQLEEYTYVVR